MFFTIPQNEAGFLFTDVMDVLLSQTLDQTLRCEEAMTAAMIMPHLILAKTKNESDGSVTKTILRRLDQWIKCDVHNFIQ